MIPILIWKEEKLILHGKMNGLLVLGQEVDQDLQIEKEFRYEVKNNKL